MRGLLGLAVIAVIVLGIGIASSQAANEAKLKQVFQAHCSSCHNGHMAPTFDGAVAKMKEWAKKYETLDEAVAHEYKFSGGAKSYDQMMQQMKNFAPGISNQDFQLLYDYFKQVFEEAKGGAKTTTATKTATKTTATATKTATSATTPTRTTTIKLPKEVYTTPPPTLTDTAWKTVKPYHDNLDQVMRTGLYLGVIVLVAGIALALVAKYRPEAIPSLE